MKRLAVIGNPVAHSRSPEIHAAFAKQHQVELTYIKLEAGIESFKATVSDFIDTGGAGFNVTVPFKHEAWQLMSSCSDQANASETVNTVTIGSNGSLHGDNTDGEGIVRDLTVNLGWQLAGARVLLLGAGGAVSGVLPAMIAAGPQSLQVFNRTPERASALARRFGGPVRAVTRGELEPAYDLIVSGSSAGLHGEAAPDLPGSVICVRSHCYDMVYGRQVTPFLKWAREQGASDCSDGLGMLVEQAAIAFQIWFGLVPQTGEVIRRLRQI